MIFLIFGLILLAAVVLLLGGELAIFSVIVIIDNWRNRRDRNLAAQPRTRLEAAARQILGDVRSGRKGAGRNA